MIPQLDNQNPCLLRRICHPLEELAVALANITQVKPEQVEVKLLLNEHVVNEGRSSALFGDEWFGLMWLVNAVLAQGYTIEPGSILITGVMGEMLPAQVGKYQGSWGPLGEINWTFE